MSTRPSPTLPRRFRRDEQRMIVAALRDRAAELRHYSAFETLAERYDELAERIRDGGPLSQQIYYGVRIPIRERLDARYDRKNGKDTT